LRERYGDDPSIHPDFNPDLWMAVGSSGGPDKNQVYGLSNTTAENLRAASSASTVGSSQSKEFVALQQHTSHLTEKYEQLSTNYELHQIIMNMTSQSDFMVSGKTSLLLLLLLQPRHSANLIFFWKHIQFVMNII
jgi:hypothetical protein